MSPLLEVDDLVKTFALRRGTRFPWEPNQQIQAVRGVSLTLNSGETVGLIGESGSGKTTLARCVVQLEMPSRGGIKFEGKEMPPAGGPEMRAFRTNVQMVFQDSYASMNPRMTMADIIEEPLRLLTSESRIARTEHVAKVARDVGLEPELLGRYRHQLSGGQLQRANVARALVVQPKLVVLDEPVSSLDASVRGQVLTLLAALRARLGLSYLLISHDLHTVRSICDRVFIMFRGRVVEAGATEKVFSSPLHPYTQLLMASRLSATASHATSKQIGSLTEQLARWHARISGTPKLVEVEAGHSVASDG